MAETPAKNPAELDQMTVAKAFIMGRNMFGPGQGKVDWSEKKDECASCTAPGSTCQAVVCKASPSNRLGLRVAEKPVEPRSKKCRG
jgi:hypothetical protein